MERHNRLRILAIAVLFLAVLLIQFFQLQLGTVRNRGVLRIDLRFLPINLALTAIPTALAAIFFRRLTAPLLLTGALYTLWSVANAYVVQFHGTPLFLNELLHASDAAEVIALRDLRINPGVILLLTMSLCELVCIAFIHRWQRPGPAPRRVAVCATSAVLCAGISMLCLYGPAPMKERFASTWDPILNAKNMGFMTCLVEDADKLLHPCTMPEGYSADAIRAAEPRQQAAAQEAVRPDIILILNESFFDLSVYTDLDTDVDYLAPYSQTPNAVFGHAVSPCLGGGTNDSEFELLTSDSTYLLTCMAPFNYRDLGEPHNSLPRYLSSFGYESWGLHCCNKRNYSRGRGYPQLGFDHVIIGTTYFENLSYGNRIWLDRGVYKKLIEEYEAGEEAPRFMYLLTYQNHSVYTKNPPELDKVHVRNDFGNYTDQVDEYLTSAQMSAQAFRDLTEYFSGVDRPVIVCMMGDHAPVFVNQLPPRAGTPEREAELNMRLVPYVIWANYDAPFPEQPEYASTVDLGPMLLEMAGIPLSDYYETILSLRRDFPLRSGAGMFLRSDGEICDYDLDDPAQEPLRQYFYKEYNSLKAGKDYRAELFQPKSE